MFAGPYGTVQELGWWGRSQRVAPRCQHARRHQHAQCHQSKVLPQDVTAPVLVDLEPVAVLGGKSAARNEGFARRGLRQKVTAGAGAGPSPWTAA